MVACTMAKMRFSSPSPSGRVSELATPGVRSHQKLVLRQPGQFLPDLRWGQDESIAPVATAFRGMPPKRAVCFILGESDAALGFDRAHAETAVGRIS